MWFAGEEVSDEVENEDRVWEEFSEQQHQKQIATMKIRQSERKASSVMGEGLDLAAILLDLQRMRLELERSLESSQEMLIIRKGSIRGRNLHVFNTIRMMRIKSQWQVELLRALKIKAEVRDLHINSSFVDELADRMQLKKSKAYFCFFAQREVSVLSELALIHLLYSLTDVPPQSKSSPHNVFSKSRNATVWHYLRQKMSRNSILFSPTN
uniref:K-box domain-containing protein n=1 Tax=Angiostrongylus cantonensis TaxID=6313 RepID=A0A158P8B5_ANGCA